MTFVSQNFVRFFFTNSIQYEAKKLAFTKLNEKYGTKKPPLVILHGIMGCRANWNTIAVNLTKKLNPLRLIYMVDARNHGQSPHHPDISYNAMSDDIKLFIDTEIKAPSVALMGHSLGGLTCSLFALKNPQIVEKLIVIDVSPIVHNKDTKFVSYLIRVLKRMREFPIKKGSTLTKERQKLYKFLKQEVPNERSRQFLLKNLVKSNGNIKWQLNLPHLIDNSPEFRNFPNLIGKNQYKGPTCFIGGSKSRFLQDKDYPEIRKLFPNTQFHIIPDAGHWLHNEKQQEFIQIVSDALNK